MFIPQGYVLLTAAVDRLAESRRPAGQTNDDRRSAAREELRGEFYNDTISPLVVSRSGKKYKIRPYGWGSEKALTWFEQGEFWLIEHENLVDPPLRMFHEELAHIFVREHDLQRLMAKQEINQEAAPRLDVKELWPKSPPLSGEPLDHVEKPEPEQTRPAEPESPTPAPASKRERPQAERAKRYIEKNFPNSTKGITTAKIREELAQDKDLQAELKERGRELFSATVINRVLGRRKA